MIDASIYTVIIAAIIMVFVFIYILYRRNAVKKLNNALATKDYDFIIEYSQNKMVRRIVGVYNCDFYYLKAYYLGKGKEGTKEALIKYLESEAELEQKEKVLDIYFHIYLHSGDRAFCDKLLTYMEEYDDEIYYRYQKWAYDVVLDHDTSKRADMEAAIDHNQFSGFGLGVVCFCIGLCYYYNKDYELARSFIFTSKDCFKKDNMYVEKAEKLVDELNEIIGDNANLVW